MVDSVFLLLLMGIAGCGVLVALLRRLLSRWVAVIVAAAWYFGCCAALTLVHSGFFVDPLALARSTDFAGAAPLHLSLFVFVEVLRRTLPALASGDRRGPPLQPPVTVARAALIVVALAVIWVCWLVALEGEISATTPHLLLNCAVAGGAGAVTAAVFALIRRRTPGVALVGGAVAGFAASSASAASTSAAGAAGVGAVAGVLGVAWLVRRESHLGIGTVITPAGLGALVGLVAVGLMDVRAGFAYTGQPTLLVSQLMLVAVSVSIPLVIGLVIGAVLRRTRMSR